MRSYNCVTVLLSKYSARHLLALHWTLPLNANSSTQVAQLSKFTNFDHSEIYPHRIESRLSDFSKTVTWQLWNELLWRQISVDVLIWWNHEAFFSPLNYIRNWWNAAKNLCSSQLLVENPNWRKTFLPPCSKRLAASPHLLVQYIFWGNCQDWDFLMS